MASIVSSPVLWVASLALCGLAVAAIVAAWRQLGRSAALLTLLAEEAVQSRTLLRLAGLDEAGELRPEMDGAASRAVALQRNAPDEPEPATEPQPEQDPQLQPQPGAGRDALSEPPAHLVAEPWTTPDPEFAPVRFAAAKPEPISELDRAVAAVNDPLGARLEMLTRWEAAAGVRLGALSTIPVRFRHYHRELEDAQSMLQVLAAGQDIEASWPELLSTLAGSMDRDLDPGRANEPLQRAMAELLRDLDVGWIDPAQGELFDPVRHQTLGVFRPGTAAEAGRVGEVLCRGLQDARGRVLLRAEVREFG